jgi:hypothetical protein
MRLTQGMTETDMAALKSIRESIRVLCSILSGHRLAVRAEGGAGVGFRSRFWRAVPPSVLSGRGERAANDRLASTQPPLGDGGPSEPRLRNTGEPSARPEADPRPPLRPHREV